MRDIFLEIGGGTNRHPQSTDVIDPSHPFSVDESIIEKLRGKAQDFKWPFNDGDVQAVYASHVMEHIPAGVERIAIFNEAHRVLKIGGFFDILVPLVGFTQPDGTSVLVNGWQPYADPTHVSYWWFPESLLYFCEGDFKAHADYGMASWRLDGWHVNFGFEGVARLVKV